MSVKKSYLVSKCIVGVSASGRVFHYFRNVKNLNGDGLYIVEEIDTIDEDQFRATTYIFWNKNEVDNFDELIGVIELLKKEKLRQKRLQALGLN